MIEQYLGHMATQWSPSTLKSETARLRRLSSAIDGNPERLASALAAQAPYTRKTSFIRVAAYWGWAHSDEPNPYTAYMHTHKRKFKHAYTPKKVQVTYEEAFSRISGHPDHRFKKKALELLLSGQRWAEATQAETDGQIKGKGGKWRPSFRPIIPGDAYEASASSFRRTLQGIGLRPHELRKLALTRLAQKGATAADLMRVAGWSSMAPAMVYIQERRDEELKEMLK